MTWECADCAQRTKTKRMPTSWKETSDGKVICGPCLRQRGAAMTDFEGHPGLSADEIAMVVVVAREHREYQHNAAYHHLVHTLANMIGISVNEYHVPNCFHRMFVEGKPAPLGYEEPQPVCNCLSLVQVQVRAHEAAIEGSRQALQDALNGTLKRTPGVFL